MKLLFDTHTFIWWDSEPSRLSASVYAACHDSNNQLLLSVASVWEMQIKVQIGKMKLSLPLDDIVAHQVKNNKVRLLPITLPHVLTLDTLPLYHKDPFDRILIAQANTEGATLLSRDRVFSKYPVALLW